MYGNTLQMLPSSGGVSAANLARAMLELYSQVHDSFTVNDQPHYQFNPRDITEWVKGLQRYAMDGMSMPEAVAHEAMRIFKDRLVADNVDNFMSMVVGVMNSHLGFR